MIGQTISHYKITQKLGEGGMGVVYKAEDTKLKRSVALKFLAPHLLQDEEARKRFHREAQAAAALNHPNVCTIHEIGEADGKTFLAMAFIEGESLDKRIEQSPLPLKDALEIARQTASGLEAAHEKGVVHRDIKPGNVMIGAKGQVTVMDFGLALLTEGSKLTQLDATVGTVAYMSPEQAVGAEVDHRTDIWALGCVLYEMACGQRPFRGVYDQALLYEIAHEQPEPLTGVRTGVPMELEWIVDKCLAKDRDERYHDAKNLILDLTTLSKKLASGRSAIAKTRAGLGKPGGSALQSAAEAGRPPAAPAAAAAGQEASGHPLIKYHVIEEVARQDDSVVYEAEDTDRKRSVSIRILPREAARKIEGLERRYPLLRTSLLIACCLLIVAGAVNLSSWLGSPPEGPETPVRRFALPVEGAQIQEVAISPDGRHIAYTTGAVPSKELWIWDLDRLTPRKIETARAAAFPFWSPNSDFVAFRSVGVGQRELKKVSVHGGPASIICSTNAGFLGGGLGVRTAAPLSSAPAAKEESFDSMKCLRRVVQPSSCSSRRSRNSS